MDHIFELIVSCMINVEHRWIHNEDQVPNIPLGENVGARIKQFSLMNKFKKKVLRVRFSKMLSKINHTNHTCDEAFYFTFQKKKKCQELNQIFLGIGSSR